MFGSVFEYNLSEMRKSGVAESKIKEYTQELSFLISKGSALAEEAKYGRAIPKQFAMDVSELHPST